MKKPLFYISCPYDTYSGYGARSRDIIKSIVKTDKYDFTKGLQNYHRFDEFLLLILTHLLNCHLNDQ